MADQPRIPRDTAALPACGDGISGPDLSAHKTALRQALLAARRAIDPLQKDRWDAQIRSQVLAWCAAHQVAELGVYWPLRGEPDLSAAYQTLSEAGVRLALPVVLARDAPLGFAEWLPGEAMDKDGMGVAVPAELRMRARPPALLVPCVGFSADFYRLGYGGGYYDRTLAPAPRPLSAGVAYGCMQARFARAPHDVALDLVLTEIEAPRP
ncbi:MAG: 5-formyltetrahydrofolate cyclo-ligase [Pseudomonadota bacterium]